VKELLQELLDGLEKIGAAHDELYDTECRDRLGSAILNAFARSISDFDMPSDFGLYSQDGNRDVDRTLSKFVREAKAQSIVLGLDTFHKRLIAFQDASVRSRRERCGYDDFFGYSNPELFDSRGNAINA
jgi:hypothetical protein